MCFFSLTSLQKEYDKHIYERSLKHILYELNYSFFFYGCLDKKTYIMQLVIFEHSIIPDFFIKKAPYSLKRSFQPWY